MKAIKGCDKRKKANKRKKDSYLGWVFTINVQAPVVQRPDNVIHRINRYPTDKC